LVGGVLFALRRTLVDFQDTHGQQSGATIRFLAIPQRLPVGERGCDARREPQNFHIPADVIKRHVRTGNFLELRMYSPRFSVHEDAPDKCVCPSCNGETTKPILKHIHPASLMPLPKQNVSSRGWGEDFWVRVEERLGRYLRGSVDNPLVETRLHGVMPIDETVFHEDHILAIHDIHRQVLVFGMDAADSQDLAQWVGRTRRRQK
jgi:hypothetical protein